MRRTPLPGSLVLLLAVIGCATIPPRRSVDCSADIAAAEREVRAISERYAQVRDIETEMGEYAEGVWFYSTLRPVPTVGRAARRAVIEARRAPVAGEYTRREPGGITVSACGDLAVEHGRYATVWSTPAGPDSVVGYYLQSYQKQDGEWKVIAASVHRQPAASLPAAAVADTGTAGTPARSGGRILPVESGTELVLCAAPGLQVNLRLDSVVHAGSPVAIGTAELAAGARNTGAHADTDEAIYFLGRGGRAFVGADTVAVEPGLMLFVPRGVQHGFLSAPDQPLRFLWVNRPQALAQRFRELGVPPGTRCPAPGAANAGSVQYRSPAGVEYGSLPDTGAVARAEAALAGDPRNVQLALQLGLAQSAVRQFREAVHTFTRALELEPDHALLHRWRGHRYLSLREFDRALADLEKAVRLDSMSYGAWYHLGVTRFARAEFEPAAHAFARAQRIAPDAGELAGATDWLWLSLSRAGRSSEAAAMLAARPDSLEVDNAYRTRLRLYRGEIAPDHVITPADTADVQLATLSYGVGNWYLLRGDTDSARAWFEKAVASGGWPAFGFIVAEAELRRLR